MIRGFAAYLGMFALAFASLVLADARGASHDVGTEIVICSGVEMTTITVGPDGQPVETAEPCPDGTSIFAAGIALPDMPRPGARLLTALAIPAAAPLTEHEALSPSARGPPALA